MVEALKTALEALKLSPRKLVAASIALGVLLFADAETRQFLGVAGLVEDYRPIIGIAFLAATVLLAVEVGVVVVRKVNAHRVKRHFKRRVLERLACLSEDEKQILRFYVAQNTRTNTLRIHDGVVQGLASAGIIRLAGRSGTALDGFAYNIAEVVWDELQEDPHLLDGDTTLYRTDRRAQSW